MSYGVTLYNLFIASPNDVNWARMQIRASVQTWNEVNTKHRRAILFPFGWETNTAPNMGRPAQEQINDKLLSEADILVGVFWTRLGTPTDEYASGTVEEIERHINTGKPTLLYFSEEPVALNSVNPEEYARLREFRASVMSRGLYHCFKSQTEFVETFNKHLAMHVNDLLGSLEGGIVESSALTLIPGGVSELTQEAKTLLKEASLDSRGVITHIRFLGGTRITTNGNEMIASFEKRELARWEAALRELTDLGLLRQMGGKGEVYEVTDQGYTVADQL